MSRSAWCLAAALAAVLPAQAEERFYPVPGPDGRIMMIRGEASDDDVEGDAAATKGEAAKTVGTAKAESPAAAAPTTEAADPGTVAAEGAAPGAGATDAAGKAAAPYAPYDSDTYVDAEAIDAAARAEEGKRRFYLIDDGMGGPRVSESDEELLSAPEEAPLLPSMVPEEPYEALPLAGVELDAAASAQRFPGLPACLAQKARESAIPVDQRTPATLVVNRQGLQFLPPTGILSAYRLDGEGLRTLVVRSYSRKTRRPAFVQPPLAFLDARGCLLRVTTDYFERRYGATDARLPMLRADLLVHAEDAFLLVLAGGSGAGAEGHPARDGLGQLKFTLKE